MFPPWQSALILEEWYYVQQLYFWMLVKFYTNKVFIVIMQNNQTVNIHHMTSKGGMQQQNMAKCKTIIQQLVTIM